MRGFSRCIAASIVSAATFLSSTLAQTAAVMPANEAAAHVGEIRDGRRNRRQGVHIHERQHLSEYRRRLSESDFHWLDSAGARKSEPELDRLSNILKTFNDQFGTLFTDADRVVRRIKEDIVPKVAADQPYLNAKKNTPNAARIELDAALMRVISPLLKDGTEFYKQFVQNESFKRFVTDMVENLTSDSS
jgi:type I site-specific restriction-modification system R (restriction) subunit